MELFISSELDRLSRRVFPAAAASSADVWRPTQAFPDYHVFLTDPPRQLKQLSLEIAPPSIDKCFFSPLMSFPPNFPI